ncbi:MAG: hypothetical protein H7338_18715 [Candidatus Sericytochromatia bacterium]|nr:hypothetical protein [Candidatus Sericytochromatia bacterium]
MAYGGGGKKNFAAAFEAAFKPAPEADQGKGAGDLLGARAKAKDLSIAAPELGPVYVIKTDYGFDVTREPDATAKRVACFEKGQPTA